MPSRKSLPLRWPGLLRGERIGAAEWLMLGVALAALGGALVVVGRILA